MSNLIPSFLKSGLKNLIGGGSENSENTTTSSNSTSKDAPKDLNELVDRIMDNPNIDNRTKREILTVILNNLQQQESEQPTNRPHGPGSLTKSMFGPKQSSSTEYGMQYPQPLPVNFFQQPHQPQFVYPPPNYTMPSYFPTPMPMQLPPYYPPLYPQQPPPSNPYQLDMLTSKINELSTEMSELLTLVKGQVGEDSGSHDNNMMRIRSLINQLSATNNQSVSVEPETVADLPSKTSSVNNSIVDTVGSAINSIGSALNLNSSKSETPIDTPVVEPTPVEPVPAMEPTPVEPVPAMEPTPVEPVPVEPQVNKGASGLTETDKQLLAEEQAAKSANNKSKAEAANNMFDLSEYAANNISNPLPAQESVDDSITPEAIEKGLESQGAVNTTGAPRSSNKPKNTNSKAGNTTGLTPLPPRVEGNPSGMLVNKQPEPSKNTKSANNLPSAIANLNKSQQEQQPQQTGGARTLKKKTGVLSSVATVLGLTNTTQKNTGSKRGRPRKCK